MHMEDKGILSLMKMEEDEWELFLDYLYALKRTSQFDVLVDVFGREKLLMLFDIFSEESIKIPKRSYIKKVIYKIKIYRYCEARGFSDESKRLAAKIFDRRKASVQRAIDKVRRVLKKSEEMKSKYAQELDLVDMMLEEDRYIRGVSTLDLNKGCRTMPVEYKLEVYQVGEDEFDTGDFLITDEKQIESFKGVSGVKFYDIDYKQEYVELPERVYQVLSVMTDKEGYYQAVISERQKGEDFEEIEINPFIEGGVLEVE